MTLHPIQIKLTAAQLRKKAHKSKTRVHPHALNRSSVSNSPYLLLPTTEDVLESSSVDTHTQVGNPNSLLFSATERLSTRLKHTPTNWSPIPFGIGVAFLAGLTLFKSYSSPADQKDALDVGPDSQVRVKGPWQVMRARHQLQLCPSSDLPVFSFCRSGSCHRRTPAQNLVPHLRGSQRVHPARMVPRTWLQALWLHLRRQL